MFPENLTTGKEYDLTVFIDNDGKVYLIFGHFVDKDPNLSYYIVELNDDMIPLKSTPQRINIQGNANVMAGDDKPNLHKRNGIYYLSSGSHYATSITIQGLYTRVGSTGNGSYGLNTRAHGNFFEWNNQWFHTW